MDSLKTCWMAECPNDNCKARLFFPPYEMSIECPDCGQRHDRATLKNPKEVTNADIIGIIQHIFVNLMSKVTPKRSQESFRVLGLSNYHCKLLSPFLTIYGMDKRTGNAMLLSVMNQGDMLDCGVLHDRGFQIDREHLSVPSYGYDRSGSKNYLKDTLEMIKAYNDGEERLVPIHADGDGHCLVHAISRALIGRELFWHPLRCNLKRHIQTNLDKYKELFKEFVDQHDWQSIVAECDPDFLPPDGELLGLRNIHIFGLANVLRRPIILLDSIAGMQSLGDYSALFLPTLSEPSDCRGKDGLLNKPLCIAWSSSGRNHYIPLVGIKQAPLPKLHRVLVPKAWGVPQSQVDQYMEFDQNDCCAIGGDRILGDAYLLRLAAAMDDVFTKKHAVHPKLVADFHHYVIQSKGVVGVRPQMVVRDVQSAVHDHRLYCCLLCGALSEHRISPGWFRKNGELYKFACQLHGPLQSNKEYDFPWHGIICKYDQQKDQLVPDLTRSKLQKCAWCEGKILRLVNSDGSIQYFDNDHTRTPSTANTCGFKHFWNGKEYDHSPQIVRVVLEWNRKVIQEQVPWFQAESDPELNSNAYGIGSQLVQKHFPGEFGSETLLKSIVDQILQQTKLPEPPSECPSIQKEEKEQDSQKTYKGPHKIILKGPKLLHKEELGKSEVERQIQARIAQTVTSNMDKYNQAMKSKINYKVEQVVKSKIDAIANEIENEIQSQLSQTLPSITSSRHPKREMDSAPGHSASKQRSLRPVPESISIKQGVKEINTAGPKPATRKFVRVVTSDGRQGTLNLGPVPPTFGSLQAWVESEFGIPPSRQRLKQGIPPKDLRPTLDEQDPLPLNHGDRVIVEIAPDAAEELANSLLKVSQSLEVNSLESLILVATLTGQSFWDLVQHKPHLFSKGGCLFRLVEHSFTALVDGKHYKIPTIPDKVFMYNQSQERLELCLEPYGHFPVGPSVERKALERRSQIQGLKDLVCSQSADQASLFGTSLSAATKASGISNASRLPKSTLSSTITKSTTTSSNTGSSITPTETFVRRGPGMSFLRPPEDVQPQSTKDENTIPIQELLHKFQNVSQEIHAKVYHPDQSPEEDESSKSDRENMDTEES